MAGERELQVMSGVVTSYTSAIQQQLVSLQQQTAHGDSITNTSQPHHVLPVQLKVQILEFRSITYILRLDIIKNVRCFCFVTTILFSYCTGVLVKIIDATINN